MHITFKDIQQSRKDFLDKYSNRKVELQEAARKLVAEYIDSLSLPAELWVDGNNVPRPYVTVGYINDKNLFQQRPFDAFDLTDDYQLKFKISTVVDDSIFGGGSHHVISVALWKDKGRLYVELDDGEEKFRVEDLNENRPFFEVCAAIKQLVLLGCCDMRLD